MSYTSFNRGRGFKPRGSRVIASSFGRPRFPPPPFRHVGPPRPGRLPPFMLWQQNNIFFQPHLSRGNPQYRPGGRRKSFGSYNARLPAPNRLPVPPEAYEEAVVISPDCLNSPQIENSQTDVISQPPLLGSEEERQQKISETADRLRQKLSYFSGSEMINVWNDDKLLSSTIVEDDCENNGNVATLKYGELELDPTFIDPMRDIGKVNSDNSRLDNTQYVSNNNNNNNANRNIGILDKNEDESQLEAIPNNQMTSLSNENEYLEMGSWLHESVDNFHNLEQSDLHEDNNVESGLLDSDLQCQFNASVVNTLQDCCDQQQDISQGNEHPTDATVIEQDVSKKRSLQQIPLPTNLTDQDILQHKNVSESEQEPMTTNLEIQKDVLESQIPTISSGSNNCNNNSSASLQPVVTTVSVLNNVTLDNQLSKKKTNPFHSGPPKLSRYTEQRKLPIDFDPSTPPPILTKQDQPRVMPSRSTADLPPLRSLFDLTAPPPNMRPLLRSTMSQGKEFPAWNNVQNPVPAIYNNIEMHAELNSKGGFRSQPLPLEVPSQSNIYLPPHIDTMQFSPLFSMPSGNPVIGTNVSSHPMFQMHTTSHNTYTSSSSSPELSRLSDCNANKDDGLNDMQEALKFAKQMTNITEKRDKKSNSKVLCESNTTINSVNDVESISLPPGEPKGKINTLKKTKRNDIHSKKIIQESRVLDHPPSEETIVQDTNTRSTETSLMNEQERPKVVFNLNNKTKVVNIRTGWRESSEKRNGIIQPVESEKMPLISKKNFESTLKRSEEERKNLKKNENNSGSTPSSESIGNQSTVSCHKKIQKNAPMEKSHSNISSSKNNAQKSINCIEKNDISNSEASWKNKIISRFLKMSRNDIFNMVNNTSLRKFDVIMKRLVKEKKSTLSLEMRHVEDEKMKLYDQQEFLNQLNAMLETDATVSITDLSTEFIHHLNEVLQLDVQRDNYVESAAAASSSQNSHLEEADHVFSPATSFIGDCANRPASSNYISQECERNKSYQTKAGYDRDAQIHHTSSRSNEFNLKDDTCSTIVSNKSSISSRLSALQHDLDDIFSEVTKKNQTPAAVKERKHCSAGQQSAKKFDDGVIMRSAEKDALVEEDKHKSENCARWIERCDRWKRKEREDPDAYRNLTKEEWEAKYGTQANSVPSSSLTKKINTNNKNLSNRGRIKKSYQRRRHSSESSKHITIIRHRTLEKDKHKKSRRRHSDDRRHSVGYSEYHNDRDNDNSNSSSSSSSSSSSTSSTSSSSSNGSNTEPNVTKLLRAIKEKEKVAKKMSLNETIRDEVNAEIERERKQKSKKSRKYHKKLRKGKRLYHKKKKKHQQSKKTTNTSDSLDKDKNEEVTRLLTENEIKKEIMESQITQEVIVKEELDIGQEENTRDAEFASSHVVMENKSTYSPPESHGNLESAPLTIQGIPLTIVNQSHAEDRPPTASPTQPKTKAQLKQMPETNADTNDNKIFFKIFTTLPEDWDTINSTKCSENLNKSYQTTTDVNCNRDETGRDETEDPPPIVNFASDIKNCEHLLRNDSDENTILRQSDETTCTSNESFISAIKMKGDISASANVSDKATIVASGVSVTTASQKSRGACKKIDIKTYYERTIQRRMNEQGEAKRQENLATSTQDLSLTPKIAELEVPINKSTSVLGTTHDGSLQDPRLLLARVAVVPCLTNSKDNDIAQMTLGKNVEQEERQTTKRSKIPKIASKPIEGDSNCVIDNAVEKIDRDTSKANVADEKLQSRVPSDSKRFKNIRSEGSKELKLKKETTKAQKKTKKKSAIAVKSISLVSTKFYPLKKTTSRTKDAREMTREKESDDTSDMNKMKIECTASPCKSKVNNSYIDIKTSTILLQNIDNNNELSHGVDKDAKEFRGENTREIVGSIESTDSSETMRNEEDRNIESANNAASLEMANGEEQRAGEISNVTSELDVVPAASINISSDNVKANVSTSGEEFNATKDAELSLKNYADQIQVEESNNLDLSKSANTIEERYVNSISESDMTSRSNSIDDAEKDQPLINTDAVSDVEMNENKINNVEQLVASDCTYKSVSADEDSSSRKTTTELSSTSNENSTGQQDTRIKTGNGVISPESVGSPFKGFLQETMMDFEQPNLFNLELRETDAAKKDKLSLNNCNVNCATRIEDNQEETSREKITKERENYEALERPYANDTSINENFDIAFGDILLASNKETGADKNDKSDLTADEDRQGQVVEKSLYGEIIAATLHEDNNIMNAGDEAEKRLIGGEKYADPELTMKESMFINEEEIIQEDGIGTKDLTSKLTTTTDPNLSDALDDAAISDDALRLSENQSTEHLNNHNIYLETNISTEKITCDKLPGFDSDEQLDNDMFYLDDRLQSAAAFDNKDEVTFSVHQETSPARYDIIPPAITPETTMIADLSHDEEEARYQFDLKRISSTDNSDLSGTSVERSQIVTNTPPRTLNVPTKAALKEAATSPFLKSLNNLSTKEGAQGMLEKAQQSETDNSTYQAPTWNVDIHNATKTHSLDTHTKDVNVNTISSTQNSTLNDERIQTDTSVGQSKVATCSMDKCPHSSGIQHNPVVELKKIKELDAMISEKKMRERTRDDVYKDRKKRNGILHKLKDKRQMKYRSGRLDLNRNGLTRKLKKQFTGTRKAILARMLEIDIEMHQLMTEKMKLHEILLNNTSSTESTVVNRENDAVSDQVGIIPTQLSRNAKTNCAKRKKHLSTSTKQSSINKRRKIIASRSLEDDKITRYTQKTKMPVIKWKKTPRLEQTLSRQEEDLEEEKKDIDETTEQQTLASKEADVSSVMNAGAEDATIQKPESNATIQKPVSNEDPTIQKSESNVTMNHDARVQEIAKETAEKTECDIVDKSSKPTSICALDKTAENRTDDSIRQEHVDVDKKNDFLIPSKVARMNCQSVTMMRRTPESLSIYSDDSTWDSLVQNTASEMHENRNVTGLVLLDEKLKKEQARTRKLKAIVRKKKKKQLHIFLKKVNNLTMEEEELPLSKLYIRKLQQKRDLLDTLSQRKEDDANMAEIDPQVLKNVDEVINAVAENRVEDLYEPQAQSVSNDIPTTSNLSSQPEKHQFYVDAEANANSDWPSREKENLEETAVQQQDNNDVSEGSNHVFKVVNQSKIPFYDERNVEPDSSVTPEETRIESHSLNCESGVPSKDLNNFASRNFDIKVSVPKTLIKDDLNLGLLQKFKNTESSSSIIGTELVDSTTNAFTANTEKSLEKTKDSSSRVKSVQVAEEEKREEGSEMNIIEKDKHAIVNVNGDKQNNVCELQKDETINGVKDTRNVPESSTAKCSEYSDTTENEDSGDSAGSNDKIAMTNITCDSDSVVEKVNAEQKKSDAEQQPSCDTKQDYRDARNVNIKEKERSNNSESGSRVFEAILDQNTRSSISIDRASEKSEESNMSVDQRSSLEGTTTSAFSFDKVKSAEMNKASKSRRKSGVLTPPVRRSTRYTNENVKPTKMNEVDSNSNSSEQESSVIHERVDQLTQRRSRSPAITWAMRDEKILNNVRRNRAGQKVTGRKISNTECEIKTENRAKSRGSSAESAASSKNKTEAKKRKHTEWQMRNCKVRLIDCKHTLLKGNVSSEIFNELGIIAINPYVSSDVSYPQRVMCHQDIAMIPAAVSERGQNSCSLSEKSYDKESTEVEILEEKPIKKSNDDDPASMEIDNQEEEAMKTQYTVHKGPILDIKVFENSFLAASEDGKIYRYSQTSNGILNIYKGHKSAVTCLHIYKSDIAGANKEFMYSGSLDGTLRCYNIMTGALIKNPVQINSPIQCMDQAWGMIFIGTKSGHVSRFQIKTSSIKGHSIEFSDKSVLALKATNEGPRRILIVASRSQPITIRDAQNGLFLRTISGQKNHTVYSLMRHNNLIYCGTSSTSINVFDFTTGEQAIQYDAGVGIVCMRLSGQLLFAGCYDGNIYVFDTRNNKLVCSIPGPGNMLLSIEVVHNKIIAGSKDKRLHSWQMPTQVRALL